MYSRRIMVFAATALDEVINSGKYDLYSDYENIQTTKGEANCESLFESNYVYDANNATGIMSNMIWVYVHWRGDMLAFNEPTQIYSHGGWGFLIRPRKAMMHLLRWEIRIA